VDPSGLFPIPACAKSLLNLYFPLDLLNHTELSLGIPFGMDDILGITFTRIWLDPNTDLQSIAGIALVGHELVHLQEQVAWGMRFGGEGVLAWIGVYGAEYGINRLKGMDHNKAYRAIRTEKEAVDLQTTIENDLAKKFPDGNPCPNSCNRQ